MYYFKLNRNLSHLDKEKVNNRWLCDAVPVRLQPPKSKLEQKVGALNEILLKVALKESAYKPFPRSYRILQEMVLV